MPTAQFWIAHLDLQPHPEGGYFREIYRSAEQIPATGLPARYAGPRACSTAIYFLLEGRQVSRLHRLASDESWHFYAGSALTVHLIDPAGQYRACQLGSAPERGEAFYVVIPAGCWFGATVNAPAAYTLVGCTVAPGFDFADFELGRRADLLARYPQHAGLIERLTEPG